MVKAAGPVDANVAKAKPTWHAMETNKSLVLRPSTKGTRVSELHLKVPKTDASRYLFLLKGSSLLTEVSKLVAAHREPVADQALRANRMVNFSGSMRPCKRWVDLPSIPFCNQCQKWGHPGARCSANILICSRCAGTHDYRQHDRYCSTCQKGPGHSCRPRCNNCFGPHMSTSHDCPYWLGRTSKERHSELDAEIAAKFPKEKKKHQQATKLHVKRSVSLLLTLKDSLPSERRALLTSLLPCLHEPLRPFPLPRLNPPRAMCSLSLVLLPRASTKSFAAIVRRSAF